jgi:hypothetical protein
MKEVKTKAKALDSKRLGEVGVQSFSFGTTKIPNQKKAPNDYLRVEWDGYYGNTPLEIR